MPAVAAPTNRSTGRSAPLRIGFLDLIDAAPLIVALEQGFFADEGLDVRLERQLGWGSIRDRLTFGQLDAAHALLGMPLYSHLRQDRFLEPLVGVMNLGAGGNAITLSRRLIDAGVRSATTLAEYVRRAPQGCERIVLGHVFDCSMHHYLLREWLAAGGVDPDGDLQLRVFPPNQMAGHLLRGYVDGFCVGEPWNTLAQHAGAGEIVALTTDVMPNHAEKSLVVARSWAREHAPLLPALVRAVLRACMFCDDERNNAKLIELLARPQYIDAPIEIIAASLNLERSPLVRRADRGDHSRRGRARSLAPETTFPSATQSLWMLTRMQRWGHLGHAVDARAVAALCVDSTAYREAAATLDIRCPDDDFPALPLCGGLFTAGSVSDPLPEHHPLAAMEKV